MNPYIQVFLAIVIVIILFISAVIVYNQEMVKAVRETGTIKKVTPIFKGIVDFKDSSDIAYDTLNPNAPNYINMGNSINQVSGAEYSYNFWLYIDNTGKTIFADLPTNTAQIYPDNGLNPPTTDLPFVLFMRGSNKVLEYNNQCSSKTTSPEPTTNPSKNYKQDVLVKAPLVKFEHGGDVLTVEFNTLSSPDAVRSGSRNSCLDIDTNWYFINQYKIGLKGMSGASFSKQWFMVSIVLQDTLPSDPYPLRNKIRSRIFVNSSLALDKYVVGKLGDSTNMSSTPLRINQGNVFVNPTLKSGTTNVSMSKISNANIANRQFMMADLTYYNYALESEEISSLFAAQFNKTYAPQLSSVIPDSSYMDSVTTDVNPNVKPVQV